MHESLVGGPRSALGSAIACGILLGVFEGVGVLMSRVFSESSRPQLPPRESLSQASLQVSLIHPLQVPENMQPSSSPAAGLH